MATESSISQGASDQGRDAVRPGGPEDTLCTEKLQIERKTFLLALKQNARGRFLRITEDVNGRRDTVIIPATGLDDFKRAFDVMVNANRH